MQSIIIYIYSYSNLKQVKKNIPPCRIKLRRKSDTFYSNKPPQKRLKKKKSHPSITSLDLDQRNRSKEQAPPFQNNTHCAQAPGSPPKSLKHLPSRGFAEQLTCNTSSLHMFAREFPQTRTDGRFPAHPSHSGEAGGYRI